MPKPGSALTLELTASRVCQKLAKYLRANFADEVQDYDLDDNRAVGEAALKLLIAYKGTRDGRAASVPS